MGLFGKLFDKKKEESPVQDSGTPVVRFGVNFDPYETSVLAVTGPTHFQGVADPESGLWKMQILLTAWMEDGSEEIHREETPLLALGNETLRDYLRQRTPSDFIIKCKARLSLDGKALLLTNLPEPGFDPDLKAILDEQKTPVIRQVDGLGKFVLNRTVNVFQAEVDWLGAPTYITFDCTQQEDACIRTAQALMADQAGWDEKVRDLAAGHLLEQANRYLAESEAEDAESLDRESFCALLAPESIIVMEDGSFQFLLDGGDLFWGQTIQVSGTLEKGVTDAVMEG